MRPSLLALATALSACMAALSGCADEAPAPGAIAVSTAEIDFGTIQVGATAYEKVLVENTGEGELSILSVAVVEGGSSTWTVEKDGAPTLAAGAGTEIELRFSPGEPGEAVGVVRIRSDDPARPQVDIALRGGTEVSNDDLDGDGYTPAGGDCDDENRMSFPGAEERCDGEDNDCDGQVPADEADADADGYRVCAGDCDDGDEEVRPGRDEVCDGGRDTDCDGVAQDYLDEDGDGWSLCAHDCDDADASAHPTAEEVCDGVDNDCNGAADDIDRDGDGRGACAGAGDCDDTDPTAFGQVVDAQADDGGDGSTDAPFTDLLDAIASLDDICRTVVVRPGSYELSRTWADGYLRIEGTGDEPDAVLISPPSGSGYRVFTVRGGATLELANLLLRNADVDGDGGAIHATDSAVLLEDVVLLDNAATGRGGAAFAEGGSLSLRGVEASGNAAGGGGGAVAVSGGALDDEGSTYQTNTAGSGGAVFAEASDVALLGAHMEDNAAVADGGALLLAGAGAVVVEGLTLWLNEAGGDGGGIALDEVDDPVGYLRNCRLQDNAAGGDGGGLAVTGAVARLVVANNTFTGNAAGGEGGAFALGAASAAGLFAYANLAVSNGGRSGAYAAPGAGAAVGWCTVHGSDAPVDLDLGAGEDAGDNDSAAPGLVALSADGVPDNDDLGLAPGAAAIDAGPPDGEGPAGYTAWGDPDGSSNDRGATGGPGATP